MCMTGHKSGSVLFLEKKLRASIPADFIGQCQSENKIIKIDNLAALNAVRLGKKCHVYKV